MKNAVKVTPKYEEEHIVSVIVHVLPDRWSGVEQSIYQLDDVELVAKDEHGKTVLLISAPTARAVMEKIETIQDLDGVLNAAMIAHHAESAESLNETVDISDRL